MRRGLWRILSLLLACNYFAFRTELFSEEFERDNPQSDVGAQHASFNLPSLNWETFDKDNAPKAITVKPWISLTLLGNLPPDALPCKIVPQPRLVIRDKSPPFDRTLLF